ncbi:cache domain-containing protein [Magnetococcales bacterium HHB-1]
MIDRFLVNTPLSMRISLMVGVILLGMLINGIDALYTLETAMMDDRRDKIHHLVESTHGILKHFHAQEVAQKISREEAQKRALTLIESLRFNQKNYFWINDMHPNMVMHPIKPKLNGTDLSTFTDPNGKKLFNAFVEMVKARGEGFVDYYWPKPDFDEPVAKVSFVKGFQPWGWIIGAGLYVDDVEAALWQNMLSFMIVVLLVLMLSILFAYIIIKGITRPLKQVMAVMEEVSDGNLRVSELITQKRNDEIGKLFRCVRHMTQNLRDLLGKINNNAKQLDQYSHDFRQSANQLSDNAHQVNTTIKTVNQNVHQTATGINQVTETVQQADESLQAISATTHQASDNMTTISAAAEEASANLNTAAAAAEEASTSMVHVREAAVRTQDNVSQIVNAVQSMVQSMSDVRQRCEVAKTRAQEANQQARSTSERMGNLDRSAREIGNVVKVINDIAGQTNMLALNAAIEAAGAGEAGAGFSVVANEVKDLAQQTSESTQNIAQRIDEIQGHTHEVSEASQEAAQSMEAMEHANQEILESVAEQGLMADAISNSIDEMSAETSEVTRRVGESSSGIEEVTRSVSEISAGVSEVTMRVSESSMGMSDVAQRLELAAKDNIQITQSIVQSNQHLHKNAQTLERVTHTTMDLHHLGQEIDQQASELNTMSRVLKEEIAHFKL